MNTRSDKLSQALSVLATIIVVAAVIVGPRAMAWRAALGGGADVRAAAGDSPRATTTPTPPDAGVVVREDGSYTSKDEVAAYVHEFGRLPRNFVTKTKARERGWDNAKGNLDEVCPGMSIGGGRYHNDDGALPDATGRRWTECDIDYHGGRRGARRLVFSDDGLIYYTADHYRTFERLY
ncbi:ribonuclease domain-containing protein [Olsenella massiliensis]|uniref:ribonuclease domain-containing protein n=1 Tax=Olsenella massiliensis TaxID=1622075 RepID=UPI0009EA8ABC|nr:ribonuclease domain-containing protein [Olsenella massiliensis]